MYSLARRSVVFGALMLALLSNAATQADEPAKLAATVDSALGHLSEETGAVMAPELRAEIVSSYAAAVAGINSKGYPNPKAATALKQYYSSEAGIKEIVADWLKGTEQKHWKEIFSIGSKVEMKIYFGSQLPNSPSPYMRADMLNKYATLIVDASASYQDAFIFLNNVQVCRISVCKNGIKMASNKEYQLSIKKEKYTDYSVTVKLQPQEQRKLSYLPALSQ